MSTQLNLEKNSRAIRLMIVLAAIAAIAVMLPLISFATSVTDESTDTATMPEPVYQITDGATNDAGPTTDATKDTSTEASKKEATDSSKESTTASKDKEEEATAEQDVNSTESKAADSTLNNTDPVPTTVGSSGIDLTSFPASPATGITCDASTKTITFNNFTYSEDLTTWTSSGQAITLPAECSVNFEGVNNFTITGLNDKINNVYCFFLISTYSSNSTPIVKFGGSGTVNLLYKSLSCQHVEFRGINSEESAVQIDSCNINIKTENYSSGQMLGFYVNSLLVNSGTIDMNLTNTNGSSSGILATTDATFNGGKTTISSQGKEEVEFGHLGIMVEEGNLNLNGGTINIYGQDVGIFVFGSINAKNDAICDLACSSTAKVNSMGGALYCSGGVNAVLKGYQGETDNVVVKNKTMGEREEEQETIYYLYSDKYHRAYELDDENEIIEMAYKARIQGDGVPSPTPDPTPTPTVNETASTSSAKTADNQNVFAQIAGLLMQVF